MQTSQATYLDVTIDSHLKWTNRIDRIVAKAFCNYSVYAICPFQMTINSLSLAKANSTIGFLKRNLSSHNSTVN